MIYRGQKPVNYKLTLVPGTKKTTTMTFRLDDDITKKLRIEADDREISVNTLVNQTLKHFVDWEMYQSKVGFVSISKLVFKKAFEKMKPNEINDFATRVGNDMIQDTALFMKGKIDLDSFISWFESRMRNSSAQISHNVEKGTHTYIMKHDLGENWSLYNKTILELIFKQVFGKKIDIKYTKSLFSFQFTE